MTPEKRAELFQKIKNKALWIEEEKPVKKKKSKKKKEAIEEEAVDVPVSEETETEVVEVLDLNELNK